MIGRVIQEKPAPRDPRQEKGEDAVVGGAIGVDRSPVRCPWCHAGCGPEEPQVAVCQGCLSRHHAACWREAGARCASCSGTRMLAPAPVQVSVAPADLELLRRGLARQAVEQVAARNRVDAAAACEALLEAASRALADAGQRLPPGAIVAIVAIVSVFLIPILAIILGR